MPEDPIQSWKTDVTGRVAALVGAARGVPRLPARHTVWAWLTPDRHVPFDMSPGYTCDVDEPDPANPTRAFCRWCGGWIRKLDTAGAARVNALHPADADHQPVAEVGDWVRGRAGIKCAESDLHEPDESLVLRMWRDRAWSFVTVNVEILDRAGRVRGRAEVCSVERGRFPAEIDPDTGEVTYIQCDPLTDDFPLAQLIAEALHDLHYDAGFWWRVWWWLARH